MTIHWKAVEQFFTVVLFLFQFYRVCNFGKFISFELETVRSERLSEPIVICCRINRVHESVRAVVKFHAVEKDHIFAGYPRLKSLRRNPNSRWGRGSKNMTAKTREK